MNEELLAEWLLRVDAFKRTAHANLAVHESAPSRVVVLSDSYQRLKTLSIKQDDLMRQALRCIEAELFRAAHVMAWAAFMDFLEEKLASDGLTKLRQAFPKWKGADMEEMREYVNEYQLIECAHTLGLCTKNQKKALLGLLNKRNECAHPSEYYPALNDTLGYITELLQRIGQLAAKSL